MRLGPPLLSERFWFPPPEAADDDGLLAMGGDLDPERLLAAYKKGIFPWYEGPIPLWWTPDPRLVLFPQKIKVSKSMQQVLRTNRFRFTMDACFRDVIMACGSVERKGQNGGTWVSEELADAYTQLQKMGYAHSFEAWDEDGLAGGLYGVIMGKVFFGESMFAYKSNASKAAFIWAVKQLVSQYDIQLIDCQVPTPHLISLGAELIRRHHFQEMLDLWID